MRRKVYGAIILSLSTNSVLIIKENSYPRELVRLGFPKGKINVGETRDDCITREVKEEVGIDITSALVRRKLNQEVDLVVFFDRPRVIMGREISHYLWVPIDSIQLEGVKYNCFYRRNIKRGKNYLDKLIKDRDQIPIPQLS